MKFILTIKTGDVENGGTDARVYVDLFGSNKNIRRVRLDTSETSRFQPGQTDIIQIELEDPGTISQLCLYHDNTGEHPSWFVETATIENESGEIISFDFNQWLSLFHQPVHIRACREPVSEE
jgi:hypothetical protein